MKLIIIAAVGRNLELGYKNDLIWKIKEDLKFFKTTTIGSKIVMGKNTFLSLPKLLPNREHLVISSTLPKTDNVEIFRNIEEFLNKYKDKDETIYVIGGASIYKELLPFTNEMILTLINDNKQADTYFPEFNLIEWNEELLDELNEDNITYSRKKYTKKGRN